ncbi:MAG: DUF2804 domain-containing protein [Kofleriaceae bacterium]
MSDLVHKKGTAPIVGAWDHALEDPNLEDAPIVHALDRFAGMPGLGRAEAAYRARFRMKSWQYMTAVSGELFVAFVVGTAGFASNGFVYAVDLATKEMAKKFAITPLQLGTTLSPTSARGAHRFSTSGLTVAIENLEHGRSFAARVESAEVSARLGFSSAARDEHMSLCVPLPGGRWNYTHKFMAFRVDGVVTIGGREYRFDPETSFGTLDFTKMYALRHAIWKWVALSGRTKQGKVIGMNLVDPTPDAPVSENAVWIDGVRDPLTDVEISVDGDTTASPWICTAESLDCMSSPIAHVEQHLDMPLVKHTLRHVVSTFTGRVRTRSGMVHDFEGIPGIAEDFDNLW